MPLVRYQVRDAHGASDPSLFCSDGRDDPQAILQGLAAAGLTGVLRQLGDLAEFAAEIFCNLHKDVMCVVARGQGLSFRVQQLETELPTIETDVFSRSNCAKPAYGAGIDWHPCLLASQHLFNQAEKPKFIEDSYQECHRPPRLFTLDRFDCAGAGACLRRYSDPSFFERSSFYSKLTEVEYHIETKSRKTKVKVLYPGNDERQDFISVSDVNLKLRQATEQGLGKVAGKCTRLKIKPPNYLTECSEDHRHEIIEACSPDPKDKHELGSSVHEDQEIDDGSPSTSQMDENKELHEHLIHECNAVEKQVEEGETNPVLDNDKTTTLPSTSEKCLYEELGYTMHRSNQSPKGLIYTKEASFADEEGGVDETSDGYLSADVSSDMETFSYVDALTTSDSEHETDGDRTLDPDGEFLNTDMNSCKELAIQVEGQFNPYLKDTGTRELVHVRGECIPDLGDVAFDNPSSGINKGSVPVAGLNSTEVIVALPGPETADGFKEAASMKNGNVLLLDKDGDRNVLSMSVENAVPSIAVLNLMPELESEGAFSFTQETAYGLEKKFMDELERHPTFSEGNCTEDSLPQPSSKISVKSRGSLSLSSLPPLPGSAVSAMKKNRAQSLELSGIESNANARFPYPPMVMEKAHEDVPPLPPLPPVGWRIGKSQGFSSLLGGKNADAQNGFGVRMPTGEHSSPSSDADVIPVSMLVQMQTPNCGTSESCLSISKELEGRYLVPSERVLVSEEVAYLDNPLLRHEMVQPLSSKSEAVSSMKDIKDACKHEFPENKSPPPNIIDTVIGFCPGNGSGSRMLQPPTTEGAATDQYSANSPGSSPTSAAEPLLGLMPKKMDGTTHSDSTQTTKGESSRDAVHRLSEVDADVPNEVLNHPRDALIEAVASHDKSRLRKVSKVVQLSNKLVTDQRNALLEEIRNRAFNLRPIAMTRPSIKGPSTNLKYAAILEKASNIRQALAGSDEEDGDNWD